MTQPSEREREIALKIVREIERQADCVFAGYERLANHVAAILAQEPPSGEGELRAAAEAYRDLATCYRLGQTPSGALLEAVEKAKAALTPKGATP